LAYKKCAVHRHVICYLWELAFLGIYNLFPTCKSPQVNTLEIKKTKDMINIPSSFSKILKKQVMMVISFSEKSYVFQDYVIVFSQIIGCCTH
jgi:hypothetical protein